MPRKIQTIGDLLNDGEAEEGSVQAQFADKQRQMSLRRLEENTVLEAAKAGVPYINLSGFPIGPESLALIPEEQALALKAICFFYDGKIINVAAVNPMDEVLSTFLSELRKKNNAQIIIHQVSSMSFDKAFRLYKMLPRVRKDSGGVDISAQDLERFSSEIEDYKKIAEKINEVNVSDILIIILASALTINASDVHIEAEEAGIAVRLRIDGVLHEAAIIDRDKWRKIISRLKLLARVKMNITNQPQDGRFSIVLAQEKIDVRCSFLPTSFGESVVMRLLRSRDIKLDFEDLGLMPRAFEQLQREMKKPNGLILTTGPTGSGKTTTLYAVLNKLNTGSTKIITLENPIEYQLNGISQSQVDATKNYTFAAGLRSILRQDPDVVMVGEIRDKETAEISVQASLTGHLVLSTLHTNDAAGVIPRLIDIGVQAYFLLPAINAVIGQRLVRRLCPHCRVEHHLSFAESEQVKKILAVISPKSGIEVPSVLPMIYKAGAGCEYCHGIGYKGRVGIYELFTIKDEIKNLALQGAPDFKILAQAIEDGMVTMLQDGIMKCLDGQTTLDEVYRVIGKFDYIDSLYDAVVSRTIGRGIVISDTIAQNVNELTGDLANLGVLIAGSLNTELAATVFAGGIKYNAGDIHIDPANNEAVIRYRIDGILYDVATISTDRYLQLLSQIKNYAGLASMDKKAVWDGRFSLNMDGQRSDCRLSIISGGYGETIVVRLLSSQAVSLNFDNLGMARYSSEPLLQAMIKTRGLIVSAGPTGSGKTTTLYGILNSLNKPDVKIITIEDPIEYHLDGVMQTQINAEEGYTFAAAMRSLLRQNPNIIMIGEIRDEETAKTAAEAGLTGHLVLSTVHASSAAGVIVRLSGLGVEREVITDLINCTIGQRLARRICPHCKTELAVDDEMMARVENILSKINNKNVGIPAEMKFYHGAGCAECNGLGYKGRIGLYEVVEMTPSIQKIIQSGSLSTDDIEAAALQDGAVLIAQDGILKVLAGETTLEEVFRTVE